MTSRSCNTNCTDINVTGMMRVTRIFGALSGYNMSDTYISTTLPLIEVSETKLKQFETQFRQPYAYFYGIYRLRIGTTSSGARNEFSFWRGRRTEMSIVQRITSPPGIFGGAFENFWNSESFQSHLSYSDRFFLNDLRVYSSATPTPEGRIPISSADFVLLRQLYVDLDIPMSTVNIVANNDGTLSTNTITPATQSPFFTNDFGYSLFV
jgi:hypothetical protein